MSEAIKHECGIALIRLRKPLEYYIEKYGSPSYAINKLYIMMEKQRNRGQDGVGVATVKLDMEPGRPYLDRLRSVEADPIQDIFAKIGTNFAKAKKENPKKYFSPKWIKRNVDFAGEVLLGHLRYGTHGNAGVRYCHPMIRGNNWKNRALVMAGNFNMTNVDQLLTKLIKLGQHPRERIDTVTVLEKVGHFLDEENQKLFSDLKKKGFKNKEISHELENRIDLQRILKRSCKDFDGGYAMVGITGYGASFVARDPAGIRPAFFYANDEIIVAASERQAIKAAFDADYDDIQEVEPGSALIIQKNGEYGQFPFIKKIERKSCSFERLYFSRATDPKIYAERKMLGRQLVPQVLDAIEGDLENTIFSYIPNSAEAAYMGLVEGVNDHIKDITKRKILEGGLNEVEIDKALSLRARVEKLVIKDKKLRTFITGDSQRDDIVSNVYDTTYDVVKPKVDNIVVIDDSIVRGTTLEKSIITLLNKLDPKRIIIVSSAPQIRYPDCYGIDMSKMQEFVAFRAMLALLKDTNQQHKLEEVYNKCKEEGKSEDISINHLQSLYSLFTYQQICDKISEIVTSESINCEVKVVYQSVEGLHTACPDDLGDWYFTGNYPTKGGVRVVNKSFAYFMEGKTKRAY